MKTFYSILYCTIRPNLDERISIGLFMANDNECLFHYAKDKLHIIKDLISDEALQLLKSNLKSIEQLAVNSNIDSLNAHKGNAFLAEGYFNYLSVYANNLLTYSKPVQINIEHNQLNFNKLFEKFVYRLATNTKDLPSAIDTVRKRLNSTIKKHVNFDVELTEKEISGLVIPAKVTFIGVNEVKVTGEMNDFSKTINFLKQQVNAHLYLVEKIKEHNPNAKFFYIGDEPSKNLKENHEVWASIKSFKTLDLVPSNEIQRVEEYMAQHEVSPFLSF